MVGHESAGPFVLALDQGTTSTKAMLVDASSGAVLSTGAAAVGIRFPRPGWVEQDAAELWTSAQVAVGQCLQRVPHVVPAALAVSNQRESVVAWRRSSGAPVGPVLGWQDVRTADRCQALIGAGAGPAVRSRTGLQLEPAYSAPKMRWSLDAAVSAGADVADVCLGTVDAWLVWNLTGGGVFATDAGNASRTLLFDLQDLRWDEELLELFGLPASVLPEVRASDAGFGTTQAGSAIPAGVPVASVLADSHAALYSHGRGEPGVGKATYGTGSSVMTPCAAADGAPDGIATTLAWLTDRPTYAREGNIVASGSALDWMAATLGAGDGRPGGAFLTELADGVPDAAGVCFVPAFTGLGAPYWDRHATGVLTGVTGGTTRGHLARAALEAVAHQVADVVERVESDGRARIDVLHGDGGATASRLLMQCQADLLGRPLRVADASGASALGAALMAARSRDLCGPSLPDPSGEGPSGAAGTVFLPAMAADERSARRADWAAAVSRSRGRSVQPLLPSAEGPPSAARRPVPAPGGTSTA